MKNSMFLVFLSTALLALSAPGHCGGKVNEFKLSNGMRGIFRSQTGNSVLTVQLFFPGGGINESEKQAGLANFTHTLLIKGTGARSADKLADEIDAIGANVSSDIDYDFATLGISSLDSYFDKACELLSDMAFNPAFDEKEIEKERVTLLASIRSRQDSIFDTAGDAFNKLFYGRHPYAWPEVGRLETVSKFKKGDLDEWHRAHYNPGEMLIVIVGDVDLREAENTAEKYFGKIKNAALSAARRPQVSQAREPEPQSETLKTVKFQQAYLMLGFPAPAVGREDYAALKVINSMLGSRMSGRLFTELREKLGLGYEVNCFYPTRRQLSRFVIYLGLEKKNVELAKTKIRGILDDLKKNPVSEKELLDTKNYIKGMYLMDHQTINRQAWYLGWWESMGMGYGYDKIYTADLEKISAQDVMKAAGKYFNDRFVQVELIPSGGKK